MEIGHTILREQSRHTQKKLHRACRQVTLLTDSWRVLRLSSMFRKLLQFPSAYLPLDQF